MEVKLWEGGLQSQEIKAIESIQEAFSNKPNSNQPKAWGLVLDCHPESGRLSGRQSQDAQYDGVVAVPGDAERRGRTDRPFQGSER